MAMRDGGAWARRLRWKELAEQWLPAAQISRLVEDAQVLEKPSRELPAEIDPYQLSETGWGMLYSQGEEDRGALEKLKPLLERRKDQAGKRYYKARFSGTENTRKLLYEETKESPGTIDPSQFPYYILLVGSPDEIPFEVQYALSVNHAVGRLYCSDIEDYARYAQAVLAAEGSQPPARQTQIDLFAVEKPGDEANRQAARYLIEPLARSLPEKSGVWNVNRVQGERGRRKELLHLLREDNPSSILVASCHGRSKDFGAPSQEEDQGALVCLDGVVRAADLESLDPASRPLHGLIAFLVACYSAGTPVVDTYPEQQEDADVFETDLEVISKQNFVAALPQALLARGALAIVGHVDRGWTTSFGFFHRGQLLPAARSFEDSLLQLMAGHRLGHALRPLVRRASAIGSHLLPMLEAVRNKLSINTDDLRTHWTAYADARNYVVLGDPAVHIPNLPAPPFERPVFEPLDAAAQPVYLDAELAAKIRKFTEKEGLDMNEWIRESLDRQLRLPGSPTVGRTGLRDGGGWTGGS